MSSPLLYLNPHAARARLLGAKARNSDEGFSLIETMAAMAIVAILALAIVPQFGKYMERAAVQNVVADITSAQLLVDSDYGLSANSKYTLAGVTDSVVDTKKNPETTLSATVNTTTNTYKITGTSTAAPNYTMYYDSAIGALKVIRN